MTTAIHHALLLATAAVVLVVARRSIGAGLALTLTALIAANSSFSHVKSAFLEARWGAVVALALVLATAFWGAGLRSLRPLLPLLVLPALGLVSALWSVEPRLTIARVISFGLLLVIGAGIATRASRDRDVIAVVGDWLSLLAVAVLITSLLATLTSYGIAHGELRGIFENANGLGLYLGLNYPFVAASLERRGHARASLVALLAFGVIDVLSASRSGIVALLIGIVVYELARGRRGRVLPGVGVAVLAALALLLAKPVLDGSGTATPGASSPIVSISAPNAVGGAPGTTQTFASRLTGARSEAWSATLGLVADRPLLGFGFGTGDRIFARYPDRAQFVFFEGANPNNGYLQLLLELGILGLIALAIPLGIAVRGAVRIAREGRSPMEGAFAAMFVASLGVAVVESVFESAGAPWAHLIWIGASVLLVGSRWPRAVVAPTAQSWRPSRRLLRVSLVVVALGALVTVATLAFAPRHDAVVIGPSVAARTIAHERCTTAGCRVAQVSRVQGTVWWVRLTKPERCFVVQLKNFEKASLRSKEKPATCQALPLSTPHALTVGVFESGPPYFSPPVNDPGGFEPLVVQAIAKRLGIALVRWSKAGPGPIRPGVDLVLHQYVEGRLPVTGVPYLPVDEELVGLKSSPTASITTVSKARRLRLGTSDDDAASYVSRFLNPAGAVRSYSSTTAAVKALRAHEVDGLVVDRANGLILSRANSDLVEVGLLPTRRYFVMRFPAGSRLRPLVQRQVEALMRSGELDRLRELGLGKLAPVKYLR
jgi:O-antigen ligase/ABC-type amino acid transport substrate-binding protein